MAMRPEATATRRRRTESDCKMIAHAPAPSAAVMMPTGAETSVTTMSRSSRLRKRRSRVKSAAWVVERPFRKKVSEYTSKSGCRSGASKKPAMGVDSMKKATVNKPPTLALVQKAVDYVGVGDRRPLHQCRAEREVCHVGGEP